MPAGNNVSFDDGNLPSRPTVPNTGSLPSGGSGGGWQTFDGGGGMGAGDYGSLITAVAPSILGLFGNNDNRQSTAATGATDQLQQMAQSLFSHGQKTSQQGQDALAPVMHYLMQVAGVDPTAALAATTPQRKSVLDQYDTARKSLEFSPRGGGQASATAALESNKASTLAAVTSDARNQGVATLANLGSDLSKTGAAESASGTASLAKAIEAYESQSQRADQQSHSKGKAIGSAVIAALPYIAMAFSHSSFKDSVTPVDETTVLAKLRSLPINTWKYLWSDETHMGPMAEQFQKIFGIGDGVTLKLVDVMGVVLAAEKARALQAVA